MEGRTDSQSHHPMEIWDPLILNFQMNSVVDSTARNWINWKKIGAVERVVNWIKEFLSHLSNSYQCRI